MPTFTEHKQFVKSKPYSYWYIIKLSRKKIGTIYLSKNNEIGFFIKKEYQNKGIASEALKLFWKRIDDPIDNSEKSDKISNQIMKKYVPMVREALEEVEPYYKDQKEFEVILDNAERYIKDAEIFLGEGRDENAILSIGYADGLVDALRLAKGLEFKM